MSGKQGSLGFKLFLLNCFYRLKLMSYILSFLS